MEQPRNQNQKMGPSHLLTALFFETPLATNNTTFGVAKPDKSRFSFPRVFHFSGERLIQARASLDLGSGFDVRRLVPGIVVEPPSCPIQEKGSAVIFHKAHEGPLPHKNRLNMIGIEENAQHVEQE